MSQEAGAATPAPNATAMPFEVLAYTETFQVLIVIPILFILVVTFFGYTGLRSEKRRKDIKDIRSRTAGRDAMMPITPAFIKATSRDKLTKETERCLDVGGGFLPDARMCSLEGWGPLESEWSRTHFKNAVANSYSTMQKRFEEQNSDAHATKASTMPPRDFMALLMRHYPNLETSLARQYIRMYEYARFGRYEVPQAVYSKFFEKLLKIITLISDTNEDGRSQGSPVSGLACTLKLFSVHKGADARQPCARWTGSSHARQGVRAGMDSGISVCAAPGM